MYDDRPITSYSNGIEYNKRIIKRYIVLPAWSKLSGQRSNLNLKLMRSLFPRLISAYLYRVSALLPVKWALPYGVMVTFLTITAVLDPDLSSKSTSKGR